MYIYIVNPVTSKPQPKHVLALSANAGEDDHLHSASRTCGLFGENDGTNYRKPYISCENHLFPDKMFPPTNPLNHGNLGFLALYHECDRFFNAEN